MGGNIRFYIYHFIIFTSEFFQLSQKKINPNWRGEL